MGDLLSRPAAARPRLRELLARPEPLVAPGAYDALSARLVEQAGFDVVYMTGFGTTASLAGRPDVGLLTGTEMVDNARRIAAAVDVPVIADADTGYGNAINVVRTVQAYEQAGVAGIHLEDQVMPKKCGHMSGKAVIPADEMAGKIRAAVEARRDPDFLLIARTDAAAVEGLAAAIDRGRAYADAGADVLFVEAPTSEDDIAQGRRASCAAWRRWCSTGPRAAAPRRSRWPASRSWASRWCCSRSARCWPPRPGSGGCSPPSATDGVPAVDDLPTFDGFTDLIGLPEIRELEARFGTP